MDNLAGKVALVTGSSRGIGAAIARELYQPPHELAELATSDLRALWLAVVKLPAR